MYFTFIKGVRHVVDYLSEEELERLYKLSNSKENYEVWIGKNFFNLENRKFVKTYIDGRLTGVAKESDNTSFIGSSILLNMLEKGLIGGIQ